MADPTSQIDALMEQASEALVAMQYLACEHLCRNALAMARQAGDFERLSRIVMPLQEARRQRRQLAEDAGVILITGKQSPAEILTRHPRGCLMLIAPPFDDADLAALRELIRQRGLFAEVLLMNQRSLTAAFLRTLEEQGDAALAGIDPQSDPIQQVDALLEVIDRISDHEIAHQRLADAARTATQKV